MRSGSPPAFFAFTPVHQNGPFLSSEEVIFENKLVQGLLDIPSELYPTQF